MTLRVGFMTIIVTLVMASSVFCQTLSTGLESPNSALHLVLKQEYPVPIVDGLATKDASGTWSPKVVQTRDELWIFEGGKKLVTLHESADNLDLFQTSSQFGYFRTLPNDPLVDDGPLSVYYTNLSVQPLRIEEVVLAKEASGFDLFEEQGIAALGGRYYSLSGQFLGQIDIQQWSEKSDAQLIHDGLFLPNVAEGPNWVSYREGVEQTTVNSVSGRLQAIDASVCYQSQDCLLLNEFQEHNGFRARLRWLPVGDFNLPLEKMPSALAFNHIQKRIYGVLGLRELVELRSGQEPRTVAKNKGSRYYVRDNLGMQVVVKELLPGKKGEMSTAYWGVIDANGRYHRVEEIAMSARLRMGEDYVVVIDGDSLRVWEVIP